MRSTWEVYWRSGYRVRGASDVIATDYGRTKDAAEKAAREAAADDQARLVELGIEGEVDIWVERWRTRQVEEHDDREVVDTWKTQRRTEVVTGA